MNYFVYDTDFGHICICEKNGAISHIIFGNSPPLLNKKGRRSPVFTLDYRETPLIERAAVELAQYLSGRRTIFDVPLGPEGTTFQKKAWAEMKKIPYGSTCSLGDLAKALGAPRGYRAVVLAHNRNPISIMIPSHRLIDISQPTQDKGDGSIRKSLRTLELQRSAFRHQSQMNQYQQIG